MEQTHKNWIMLASDDGSTDLTLQILYEYQKKWSSERLQIKQGPCKGYSQNFLSLVTSCNINADYFAFCDQDDVWKPDKLKVAVNNMYLNQIPYQPYLYCGRSIYVLDDLTPITLSPLKKYTAAFENALIENIAGGNTMLFNQATKNILERVLLGAGFGVLKK
jgi:glycosyltransferase involved in cell wall biosynthesis